MDDSDGCRAKSFSRTARIALGMIVALAFAAVTLAFFDYVAHRVVSGPTEEGVRLLLELFLVVVGMGLIGLLVTVASVGVAPARRIPGVRVATVLLEWLGSAMLLAIVGFAALLGGGIALVVVIVGGTGAAVTVVYGAGESVAYLFGISIGWGLAIACALLVVISAAGGLIHDIRLEVMPPQAPPREHE